MNPIARALRLSPALLIACSDTGASSVYGGAEPVPGPNTGVNFGSGTGSFGSGDAGTQARSPDASNCNPSFEGRLRDFRGNDEGGHPDFQSFKDVTDHNIVTDRLGADRKPVFGSGSTSSTTKENFDLWWRDSEGKNQGFPFVLPATVDKATGRVFYESKSFFPVDGMGYGNRTIDNVTHNFHFTFELHTEFAYQGGEKFAFRGDDDVFVYIAGQKVVDLGGVHEPQSADVDLDGLAERLGIKKGETYPLDFFFAERRAIGSTFRFETSLKFTNCNPIVVVR
jgi:fibro-slime domain-containing protein